MSKTKTNSEMVLISPEQQNLLNLLSSEQEPTFSEAIEYVIDEAILSNVDLFSEDKEKFLRLIELKRIIKKL